MLTSLRESFMGGRGERNGEEQERERDTQSMSGEYCGHLFHFPLNKNGIVFNDNSLLCQTSPFKEKRVWHLKALGFGFIC